MVVSAFERLERILDLEEKQGWRNRAVIGGLVAMGERWAADALEETPPDGLDATQHAAVVSTVVALMTEYEGREPETRDQIANWIRRALTGEIPAEAGALVAQASQVATAQTTALSSAQSSAPPASSSPAKRRDNADERGSAKRARKQGRDAESLDDGQFQDIDEDDDGRVVGNLRPAESTDVAQRRAAQRERTPRSNAVAQDLQAATTILTGVGATRAELLSRLGINQVGDLLWHLPNRYDDFSQMRTIAEMQPGEQVTVLANLWEVRERKISRNRQMIQGILADGTGTIHAVWWNRWIVKQLTTGSMMRFSGTVGLHLGQKTLENPIFEEIDEEMVATGRLAPVYGLTEGLSNKWLRDLIRSVLDDYDQYIMDPLPETVRSQYNLVDLTTALTQVHMPDDAESLAAARQRLAFEEFFYVQLGVLQRRQELHREAAQAITDSAPLIATFTQSLPFSLTGAQQRVLDEVMADLARDIPMTRLVQGDVGSGKTAVAAGAMFAAAGRGIQSALLAPTQILAEQHHRGITAMVSQLTTPDGRTPTVALLTGRVTGQARDDVLQGLADGAIDIVMGTTALIQEQVEFQNLGLIVVDEQHRFGVEQRGALRNKSTSQPHLLVMSATPIPRSLALTVYGDLDLSIIDEMPPGRIPIKTKLFRPRERERLYGFMRREATDSRQAYIIYPLVEESEKLDVGSAVEAHKQLSEEILKDLRIGLLHGRMSGSEKDEVMRAFAAGDYDVLVSTTVIEVGIDVPNASLIVIEDAERFGLAQLHQLRGRVGRGQHKSYCALISKIDGGDGEERLRALEETTDGFVLAEKDLALRGPGDFLGTRQSGLPPLRIASLGDLETLVKAREAGQKLFAENPTLAAYPQLQEQVDRFWRGHGDVN